MSSSGCIPGTAFALYHQGMVARLEGREEDALGFYRAAAEKVPKVAPIWNNIGILLAMRGERDGAVEAFQKSARNRARRPHGARRARAAPRRR